MNLLLVTVLVCWLQCEVYGANILVVTSMPAHSHFTLAFRLAKELADREHLVTFINPYPKKAPIKNLNEISVEETAAFVEEMRKHFFELGSLGIWDGVMYEYTLSSAITEYALNSSNVQQLLKSKQEFDVVIIEHFFNEALVGIAHHFRAPIIILAPIPSCFKNNYILGNPSPSSYVPNIFGRFTKRMNFWQRLENFVSINLQNVLRELVLMPKQRELFKKYIKTDLDLDDVLYNVSLIFTTSHPSVTDAVPHLPNIIEIGGYHVSPPKKLPQDLQDFLDRAREGVVLFSMGSNLKSKDLTPNVRKAILDSFSKIKEKVLWKFEAPLPEAPPNVKIMKWLPQQDILGHPNIRAFITHGGLLGTIEAVHYGVPIIGIPVFGDQQSNIATAVSGGYAIDVPLADLTEKTFSTALDEILHNPSYRENAQTRSKWMNDQPLKPIDSAVYWIEHVIRHKGAPHFRSAALDLKWYQREMIDIFAFLTAVAVGFMAATYIIVKTIFNKIFCKTKKTKKNVTYRRKNK